MSTNHPNKSRMGGEHGFSLIDVAVVMAIVGILLAGFLATYKMYQATRASTATEENFMASQEALGAFIPFKGNRYPRPAPFGLKDQMAGYGEEVEKTASAIVTCATATAAVGKVCRGTGASGESVLIGVLPFADLNMTDTQARDGYGRLFTYAVSEALTEPGGIDPIDSNSDGIPDRDADGDLIYRHYVCVKNQELRDDGSIPTPPACTKANGSPPRPIALISHGADGLGGWLPSGQMYGTCGAIGTAMQNENCNFDGTFVQAMRLTRNDNGTPGSGAAALDDFDMRVPVLIRGEGPNKNDDAIQVEVREDGNYWGAAGTDKVSNKYNYKIGIGVAKPEKPLDVKGNILANEALLSQNLCASGAGGACLETEALAGDLAKMDCGQMGMVREIKGNKAECIYVAQKGATCSSNEYIEGFNSDGSARCRALPPTCGPAHGTVASTPPAAATRCTSGVDTNFTGTNPWSWKCEASGGLTVSCSTVTVVVPPSTTGCIDECGEQKNVGATWCNRGNPKGKMRCAADGQSPSYDGCISGLGCCAGGTLMCP